MTPLHVQSAARELLAGLPQRLDRVFRPWAESAPERPALIGRRQGLDVRRSRKNCRRCGGGAQAARRARGRPGHGREREQPGAGRSHPGGLGDRRLVGGRQSPPVRARNRPDPRPQRRPPCLLHGGGLRARPRPCPSSRCTRRGHRPARHLAHRSPERDHGAGNRRGGWSAPGRGAALHVGHDRQSQGRDAHASQHPVQCQCRAGAAQARAAGRGLWRPADVPHRGLLGHSGGHAAGRQCGVHRCQVRPCFLREGGSRAGHLADVRRAHHLPAPARIQGRGRARMRCRAAACAAFMSPARRSIPP